MRVSTQTAALIREPMSYPILIEHPSDAAMSFRSSIIESGMLHSSNQSIFPTTGLEIDSSLSVFPSVDFYKNVFGIETSISGSNTCRSLSPFVSKALQTRKWSASTGSPTEEIGVDNLLLAASAKLQRLSEYENGWDYPHSVGAIKSSFDKAQAFLNTLAAHASKLLALKPLIFADGTAGFHIATALGTVLIEFTAEGGAAINIDLPGEKLDYDLDLMPAGRLPTELLLIIG